MTRKYTQIIALSGLLLLLGACGQTEQRKTAAPLKFIMPQPPLVMTSEAEKGTFVVAHYWDKFDFRDTTLISRADYTEQAFADFVNLLPHVEMPSARAAIDTLMCRAAVDTAMYAHFIKLSEKYLYDPNSPFRNENLYIEVLRNIVDNPTLDPLKKARPQYQLELALKNRVGEPAANFTYTTDRGATAKLYSHAGDPLMVMFFNPDCPTCKATREYIQQHDLSKRVKIVYINMEQNPHLDSIYDLRASPTLYLLDKDKRVILKDVPIEQLEQYVGGTR